MSAVSMPIPITRIRRRTIRFGPALGACFNCSKRAFLDLLGHELLSGEIALQLSERIGRNRFALGRAQLFQALRCLLEPRIEVADAEPRQGRLDAVDNGGLLANEGFALAMGRLASSSAKVGIAHILQWSRSPRSQPKKTRLSCSVSRRSVLARRCSRGTATLAA